MRCKECGRTDVPNGAAWCCWCGTALVKVKKKSKEVSIPKAVQLSSGTWRIQLLMDGTRHSITAPTERECIEKARAIKTGYLKAAPSSRLTLRKAIDRYIERREGTISPSTVRSYRDIQRNRFKTAMDQPLTRYDQKGWQRLVSQEAKLCSPKSVKNAWVIVNAVIKEETGESYTVKLPQIVPTKEAQYLEPAQIKKFLTAVHGSSVELPALLALHSLRRSELLAVTWEDIDLKRKVIHVRGAVVYGEDGKLVEKAANKNRTSRRTVPIMIPRLYELLEEQWQPSGPVVTQAPTTIFAAINRICKAEDLPQVGIHGLRHSFASLAAHIGMQEKTTMEIGGWANDTTMRRIYTHALTVDRLTGSNKMADYFTATPAQ